MIKSMERGLVSVVLVTYNHEKYIREALDSVAAQTYRNFEIILINDASHDGTEMQIKEWIEANNSLRVNYISHTQNKGLHYGLNEGLDLSIGEFIQFLSGDDKLMPEKLELQVKMLTLDPEIDYVYASYNCFNDKGIITQNNMLNERIPIVFSLPKGRILVHQLSQMMFSVMTLLVRSSFFKIKYPFRFDPEIIYEDLHLLYMLGLHGSGKGSRKVLVGYRYNERGISITNTILEKVNEKSVYIKLYSRIQLLRLFEKEPLNQREKKMLACSFHVFYLLNYPTGQQRLDDLFNEDSSKYSLKGIRLKISKKLIKIRFPYNCFFIYFLYDLRIGFFFFFRSILGFFKKRTGITLIS